MTATPSTIKRKRIMTLGRLVETSPVVVFLWRMEPECWPVEAVSAGVERLLGYTTEDLTSGRVSWPGITHPEDVPRLEHEVASFLAQGRDEWTQVYRLIAKDGRTVWAQDRNHVIRDEHGNPTHVQGLLIDITALKQAEADLRLANELLEERTSRLQALAAELTQVEHRERRRIAHLLHEDLQQRLAAITYKLHELKDCAQAASALQLADQALQDLAEAIALTRDLTTRVSPPVLYQLGLRPALERLAEEMMTHFSLSVRITGLRAFRLPSDEIQHFAYDAVRELLLNVTKHAGVKSAEIRIRHGGQKRISVAVCDKGAGLARSHEQPDRFGLFSIRERAEAMGVGFDIRSLPGQGTRVELILPTV